MMNRHMDLLIELEGEHTALLQMRRHAAAYAKGMPGAAEMRRCFNEASGRARFIEIIDNLGE